MSSERFSVIGALQANHMSDDTFDMTRSPFAYYIIVFSHFILLITYIYYDIHEFVQ